MNEITYRVSLNGVVQARDCTIEAAIIPARAFFEEYYLDKNLSVTIAVENKDEKKGNML